MTPAAVAVALVSTRHAQKPSRSSTKLGELNSRLSVGLSYDQYSTKVGDARVTYDQTDFGSVEGECLKRVGVMLEEAMNLYARAASRWNDCITDSYCDTDSIGLQAKWENARVLLDQAKAATP